MKDEYSARLKELQQYLKEEKIDVGMVKSPASVYYYTGFNSEPHERFMALVVDNRNDQFHLFVPALDAEMAANESTIENITPISDEQDPFTVFKETLGGTVANFGLETKVVSFFEYNNFNTIFPGTNYTDIQPFISNQRMKKSRYEINLAQEAVDIIEKVLEEGIKKIKVGMTESEIVAELEYLMRKFGSDGPSFATIALAGEKSALPHGSPGDRVLNHGEFLLIDMGVLKNGYCSDTTRTFVMGEATEKQKEIYDIVLKSNMAGIEAVKAGVPLKTFDIAGRDVIENSGYGDYFHNRIGHGLGIEVHEEPSVHKLNESIAENGLLFTIEPGIYIPELGGVRIEDTVYINENGEAEVLTSFPKDELIVL